MSAVDLVAERSSDGPWARFGPTDRRHRRGYRQPHAADAPAGGATVTTTIGRWPFVGRADLLERFADVLAAGDGGLVVAGPSGVGKTRLVEEAAARAEAEGRTIRRAVASRTAARLPLGALAHLLPPDTGPGGGTPLDRARRTFGGGAVPSVLVVDDLHLLDVASLTLVLQLVADHVVILLATIRTGDPLPEAVTAVWRDGLVARLDVDRLDRATTATLLHLALGGPTEELAAATLWDTTQGNVLYLRELVIGALRAGVLVERGGVWGLTGPLPRTGRLVELVEARLADLDPDGRGALDLLAWCEPVGLSDLEGVAPVAALDELERSGLVRIEVDGQRHQVRLAHPVYGEVLRDRTTAVARRALLRAHAERIEAHGARRREDPLRIATWRLDAGDPADPHLLRRAALLAAESADLEQVVRLGRAALGSDLPEPDAGGTRLLVAQSLHELGRFDEAEALLAHALAQPCAEGLRAHLLVARTRNLVWGLDRSDDALALLADARAAHDWSPLGHAELVADEATVLTFTGRPLEALERLAGVDVSAPQVQVAVAGALAPALDAAGRPGEAAAVAADALALIPTLDDELVTTHPVLSNPGAHLAVQCWSLIDDGRLDEAEQRSEAAFGLAVEARAPLAQAWYGAVRARVAAVRGQVADARARYQEAANLATRVGHRGPAVVALSGLALAEAQLGRVDAAREALARRGALSLRAHHPELAQADAWTALAAGDPEAARAVLLDAAERAAATGHVPAEGWLRHEAIRLGDRTSVDRLLALAERSTAGLLTALAAHAVALRDRDGDALAAAAVGFEALGADLLAAEAAAEGADALRRAGHQRRAAELADRAQQLEARCQGAQTPALARPEVVVPLTEREREVALLAAAGVASKVIAERLAVSIRTVNNHLQHAYTKLGVTNRAELAAALQRGGTGEGP